MRNLMIAFSTSGVNVDALVDRLERAGEFWMLNNSIVHVPPFRLPTSFESERKALDILELSDYGTLVQLGTIWRDSPRYEAMPFMYDAFFQSKQCGGIILDNSAINSTDEWAAAMTILAQRAREAGKTIIAEATAVRPWITENCAASKAGWNFVKQRLGSSSYYQPGEDHHLIVDIRPVPESPPEEPIAFAEEILIPAGCSLIVSMRQARMINANPAWASAGYTFRD